MSVLLSMLNVVVVVAAAATDAVAACDVLLGT